MAWETLQQVPACFHDLSLLTMLQLFHQEKPPHSPQGVDLEDPDSLDQSKEKRALFCKECRTLIAHENDRISVDGQHLYRFSNPHGIVFLIGCFRSVRSCWTEGQPEEFWSWFPEHAWQILRCEGCNQHLGWRYSNPHDVFYGLVMTSLLEGKLD